MLLLAQRIGCPFHSGGRPCRAGKDTDGGGEMWKERTCLFTSACVQCTVCARAQAPLCAPIAPYPDYSLSLSHDAAVLLQSIRKLDKERHQLTDFCAWIVLAVAEGVQDPPGSCTIPFQYPHCTFFVKRLIHEASAECRPNYTEIVDDTVVQWASNLSSLIKGRQTGERNCHVYCSLVAKVVGKCRLCYKDVVKTSVQHNCRPRRIYCTSSIRNILKKRETENLSN